MTLPLSKLPTGQSAIITKIQNQNSESIERLMELGFCEGENVLIKHRAPFGGDPIAVETLGSLIALNLQDAESILVESNN